jgi:hypothetical protein
LPTLAPAPGAPGKTDRAITELTFVSDPLADRPAVIGAIGLRARPSAPLEQSTAPSRSPLEIPPMTNSRSVIRLAIWRLLINWGQKIFLISALVAFPIGLAWLGSCASGPCRPAEPSDKPGSGVVVRTELVRLWLPETLIELSERRSLSAVPQTHSDLRFFLERRSQTNLWYALTIRGHQANGGNADVTYIRRPYGDLEHFQEFLDVLAAVAGENPQYSTMSYASAELHILSRELSQREPTDVVHELRSRSSPRADGWFRDSLVRDQK